METLFFLSWIQGWFVTSEMVSVLTKKISETTILQYPATCYMVWLIGWHACDSWKTGTQRKGKEICRIHDRYKLQMKSWWNLLSSRVSYIAVCRCKSCILLASHNVLAYFLPQKMRLGAVLEALEGPRNEDVAKLVRLRCRASDGTEGWVTYKGAGKPRVFCCLGAVFFCLEQNAKCKCERILKMPNVLQIFFFWWKCLWVSHLFDLFKRDDVLRVVLRFSPGNQGTTFLEPGRKCFGEPKKNPQQPRSAAVAVARNGHGFFSSGKYPGGQKYVCLQATEITEALDVSSTSIRMLAEGELIEVYLWRQVQVVDDGIEMCMI